jgi:hypothetical protein
VAFVLGKCDAWIHLLDGAPLSDPLASGGLDWQAVENNSKRLRAFLFELCPTVVANAEALTGNIQFFAVSSFGHTPVKIGPGEYAPDPTKLKPRDVEGPVLWILSQLCPRMIGDSAPSAKQAGPRASSIQSHAPTTHLH